MCNMRGGGGGGGGGGKKRYQKYVTFIKFTTAGTYAKTCIQLDFQ